MMRSKKTQPGKRRWVRRVVLGALVLMVLTVAVVVVLLQRPPAAWRHAQRVLDQTTPQMREQISERVKQRLAEIAQASSPVLQRLDLDAEDRTQIDPELIADAAVDQFAELTLSNEELVSVVNDFFVEWTEQRGYVIPGGINDPVVIAKDGQLFITFMILTPYWQQVFSGKVDLTFKPDGMAIGRVNKLYAGSLPVSVLSVGEMLRLQMPASAHDTAERLGDWLAKLKHFEFRPTLEMPHRRRARVLAMTVGDNDVTLQMRVQDHRTYRSHNHLLGRGKMAVTDVLELPGVDGSKFADVPTTTE